MSSLVYPVITSLDGYVVDAEGSFDWAEPDEEVHAFVNEMERPIGTVGTYLLGRRLYETMKGWETMPLDGATAVTRDFAELWRAADKVVFSTTLDTVSTERTRLESTFDPDSLEQALADAVARPGLGRLTVESRREQRARIAERRQKLLDGTWNEDAAE